MQFNRQDRRAGGFTLVELLVVMAIVAIMAGVAIPGIVRLVGNSRDEMSRSARTLYTMLRAARIYATANRVDTAVIYRLDNAFMHPDPAVRAAVPNPTFDAVNAEFPGRVTQITDSFSGNFARAGEAIAVARKLKPEELQQMGFPTDYAVFVPVEAEEGNFQEFPGGMSVLFTVQRQGGRVEYYVDGHVNFTTPPVPAQPNVPHIRDIGMQGVKVFFNLQPGGTANNQYFEYPGHVFEPSGALDTSASTERVTIYVAPRPDAPVEDRFVNPDQPMAGLPVDPQNVRTEEIIRSIPINLYRSTGRAEIDS